MTDVLKAADRPQDRPKLVVGISGASGVVYGVRTLDACRELGVESHLVVSKSAVLTLQQ
jgi:4-hydroxy-3-polyprenylbenzoate decarboxylase